jgi:integrase
MATKTTRRSKGDGLIRQRHDGSWEGRIPVGRNPETGKTQYKTFYAKSIKDVREKMKLFTDDIPEIKTATGTYIKVEEKPENDSITFAEWLDTWLTQYKINSLTPGTYESYRVIIEQHLKPDLGSVPITKITTDLIQEFLNIKLKKGARKDGRDGKLSSSSVMKMKIVINASLKQAVKNRLIPFNPTEAVTPPKMNKKDIRVLTPEEQDKFMNSLNEYRLEALFKLALATGMRKGELIALTWDCVDFDSKTISITKSAGRVRNQDTKITSIEVGSPKSKSSYRMIPMLPAVVPILEKHIRILEDERKEAGSVYKDRGLVFPSSIGSFYRTKQNQYNVMEMYQ